MSNLHRRRLLCILPLILSVSLGCFGCGSKRTNAGAPEHMFPEEIYVYEKDAIALSLKADPSLNLYSEEPHTLAICVYQLRNPNAFNQLGHEKQGLSKLMECSVLDPSVTSAKMEFVQPGKELKQVLDRAEGAKYVGIVAGYYSVEGDIADPRKVTRVFFVPVKDKILRSPKVEKLVIDLYLGPHEIQDIKEQ